MTISLRSLAKLLLPDRLVRRIVDARRRANYGGLTTKGAFEKVYEEGFWGRDQDGNPISGTGSHDREIVAPYVSAIRQFLAGQGSPTVADLGCGDFNIGRQLVDLTKGYLACDISETILDINRRKFAESGVEFRQLDLGKDTLPKADICLVRQVLQHLSNDEIGRFIAHLHEQQPYRYLVVTEHVAVGSSVAPNIDKASGPGVRVEKRSGVDVTAAPFGLRHFGAQTLLEVGQPSGGVPASIVTVAYRLTDPVEIDGR